MIASASARSGWWWIRRMRVRLWLDNRRLVAFLGEEPRSPLNPAVTRTVSVLRCLYRPAPAQARIACATSNSSVKQPQVVQPHPTVFERVY
jgi:hypothetical protein